MRVVKRSARTKDGETWRVAIVPIHLSGADYRRAHEACHKAASLWNFFLASIHEYWKENETDPTEKEMRHFLYEQRPDLRDGLHAHTVQLILGDLMDAVSTYRSNRDSGDKNARAPHREKNYRPLEFTAGFGWRVTPDGRRIALSFGKGHKRIALPLPEIADPKTGEILPSERWGPYNCAGTATPASGASISACRPRSRHRAIRTSSPR